MVLERCGVVVVGAGPTGLAAAVALAQGGEDVAVVDPGDDKGVGSKALTIHAGTLRALAGLGCVDEVLAEGLRVQGLQLRTRRSLLVDQRLDGLPGPYPFAVILPQPRTESILRVRAAELGVRFVKGRVVDVTQTPAAAAVVLDERGRIEAPYVVAADGTRSATRQAAGIAFPRTRAGRADDRMVALADCELSGPVDTAHVTGYPGPRGLLMLLPLPGGQVRVAADLRPGQHATTADEVQQLIRDRGPRDLVVRQVGWTSQFRFSHRLADRFRSGRVLLAGDAAHVHSPVGGQGMNLGIRDACYLADALRAAANDGEAPLDAYAADRRRVAAEVITVTTRMSRMLFAPRPVQPLRDLALRATSGARAGDQALALSGLLDTGPRPVAAPVTTDRSA